MTTDDLIALDRQYLWHPFTPMKPWCENKDIVVIERGEREFLIDTEGRRYIDGVSSLWCNVHGHNVPELNDALTAQLQQIAHSTLLGLANVPSILLAQRLIDLVQSRDINLTKAFYSDNGSTAVEVAAKMAYQYWRNTWPGRPAHDAAQPQARARFIAFQNAYHGDTIGAVSVGGIPLFHSTFKSLTFPVDFVPIADVAAVEQLLCDNPHAYAAIIVEPLVLGAGGMVMYPADVLTKIRQLADKHNTLLIFDEVLTGFGRTGKMFAAEHANVTPDLMCLSKGLTAGYMPLGVTIASQKIFDAFYVDPNTADGVTKTFFHGHTYTGHPLACAVALASLDLFEKNNLLAHVQSLEPILAEALQKAMRNPYVANPRQLGLIAAFDLVDPITKQPFPYTRRIAAALCTRLRARGIMLRPLADTIILMPPLAITRANMQTLCGTLLEGLAFLPEIVGD